MTTILNCLFESAASAGKAKPRKVKLTTKQKQYVKQSRDNFVRRFMPSLSFKADNLTDEQLLAGIARREHHALQILYERYGARFLATGMRYLNAKAKAESVLQETFLRIWEEARSYSEDEHGTPYAWMMLKLLWQTFQAHSLDEFECNSNKDLKNWERRKSAIFSRLEERIQHPAAAHS